MTSHFSALGFQVTSQEDFVTLAQQAYQRGQVLSHASGAYFFWDAGVGIELWGQLDPEGHFVGMNPHFTGTSRLQMGLTSLLESGVMDCAYHAWASPQDAPEDGMYPLVFDCPNAHVVQAPALPSIQDVRITAFAHEITVFTDEAHYDQSQESEVKFAAESFIPSGLFGDQPQPYGMFTGTVQEARLLHNPVTEAPFWHALVQTLGGTYDVVLDPELLYAPLEVGNIVQGQFWLTGKLLG